VDSDPTPFQIGAASASFSLDAIANPDERKPATVTLTAPGGKTFPLEVEFYVNRLNGEPVKLDDIAGADDEEDEIGATSLRNAQSFCDYMAAWKLTGPVRNRRKEVVVESGQIVPLEPHIVRLVPYWVTNQITDAILDIVYPNRDGSKPRRKR
jgi:hypothetical protein